MSGTAAILRSLTSTAETQTASPELISRSKCFGGYVSRYRHYSESLNCTMGFAVYTPPSCVDNPARKRPALYWLSGLTCDDTNFITKAGAIPHLAQHDLMIICPDTSPRNCNIPGEDDDYDFGTGAGFYISATTEHYKEHYHMYEYVSQELPAYVEEHLPAMSGVRSIFGHSMGGLGALNIFLKNPSKYHSISAFAPICNPISCQWGVKAFTGYLGEDKRTWEAWDPSVLLSRANPDVIPKILISQGEDDQFLETQLKPFNLPKHASLRVEVHPGYDHRFAV
eukprot:gene1294-4499_t